MPRTFDEVMIVNPYDAGSPWNGERHMRFYGSYSPGYGYYAAPNYGYYPAAPGYGYYAAPSGYAGYYAAPGYGQPPDSMEYRGAPAGYGQPAAPAEYYGVPAGYAGYYAAPAGYGQPAEAEMSGYYGDQPEYPPQYGYYGSAPAYGGWGQPAPYPEPEMAGYYGQGPATNEYQGYADEAYPADQGMSGYVRSTCNPPYNPGCPLPSNVAGYEEAPDLSGYVAPSTVNARCGDFAPQPGTASSDVFRPLF